MSHLTACITELLISDLNYVDSYR